MACGGRLTIALYTLRHVHEGEGLGRWRDLVGVAGTGGSCWGEGLTMPSGQWGWQCNQ